MHFTCFIHSASKPERNDPDSDTWREVSSEIGHVGCV